MNLNTCFVHSLRHWNMFLHLQLLLAVLVHHHDFSSWTLSIHLDIVFVLPPRNRIDQLQIASFPSVPRCLPPNHSCEPHATLVPHADFSYGCLFDAQNTRHPPARTSTFQADLLLVSSSTRFLLRTTRLFTFADFPSQSLIRRFAVATEIEPCQQESGLFGDPQPHGMRQKLNLPLFLNRAA